MKLLEKIYARLMNLSLSARDLPAPPPRIISPGAACGDVLLLEQESIPGFHSSGRNAAMMRQCVPDPDLAKLTRDGAVFLRNLPADWPEPVQFKQNGSLLLGSGAGWEQASSMMPRSAERGD